MINDTIQWALILLLFFITYRQGGATRRLANAVLQNSNNIISLAKNLNKVIERINEIAQKLVNKKLW